jgi:hypothetical protein
MTWLSASGSARMLTGMSREGIVDHRKYGDARTG